jgi:hypothetical protein
VVPIFLGLGAGLLLPSVVLLATDPTHFFTKLVAAGQVAAGLGLPNLLLYWGREDSALAAAALFLPWALGGFGCLLALRAAPGSLSGASYASVLLLTGLWLATGASPHALVVPLTLLMVATLPPQQ